MTHCALCQVFDASRATYPAWAEEKIDGQRCLAIVRGGHVILETRDGAPVAAPELAQALASAPDVVLDGELAGGVLVAFDALTLAEWDSRTCDRPLVARRDVLAGMVTELGSRFVQLVPGRMVSDVAGLDDYYQEVLADDGEGLVVKAPGSVYRWQRSRAWAKRKPGEGGPLPSA